MTAALLVVLGAASSVRAPDLQVEAATAAGASLPELAEAVARSLVASGARVVLKAPTSGPCQYCAKVTVVETTPGTCRLEVRQDRHLAVAILNFPAASPLFDRARALAIQARLLVTWDTGADVWGKDALARPASHKGERKPQPEAAVATAVEHGDLAESAATENEPVALPQNEDARPPPASRPPAKEAELGPATAPPKSAERKVAAAASLPPSPRPSAGAVAGAAAGPEPAKPQWPWIPTVLGAGAAVGAGVCALVARQRYDALSDRAQSYDSAVALRDSGQHWQQGSLVLAGAAVVGLAVGLVGFLTRTAEPAPVSALAAPVPGGGVLVLAGAFR